MIRLKLLINVKIV